MPPADCAGVCGSPWGILLGFVSRCVCGLVSSVGGRRCACRAVTLLGHADVAECSHHVEDVNVTGDVLGACQQICEVVFLITMVGYGI